MAPLTQGQRARITLALSLLLIGVATLWPDSGEVPGYFDLCVTCGLYAGANVLLNMALFVPLGASLRGIGWRLSYTLLLALAITTAIELAQLWVIPGRFAALVDILANVGGAALGWWLLSRWPEIRRPSPAQSRVMAATMGTCIVTLAALPAWLFHTAATTFPYFGQIAPLNVERGSVHGIVTEALLNGQPFESRQLPTAQERDVRDSLFANSFALEAVLSLSSEKTRSASVVRVVGGEGKELGVIGLRGVDAYFSVRTRASALRLGQPSVAIPGAFRCRDCPDNVRHQPTRVSGARHGNHYSFAVEGVAEASISINPNIAWVALVPGVRLGSGKAQLLTLASLAAQGLLLAWCIAATRRRNIWMIAVGAAVLLVGITQAAIPALTGIAPGSIADCVAFLFGTFVGIIPNVRPIGDAADGPGFSVSHDAS